MATCTLSILEPTPRYSPRDDPYHSPAKKFAPDGASVKITATIKSQEEDLAALLRSMPKKVGGTALLQHYGLYETILQVYSSVRARRGRLPHFPDSVTMRTVYQAVFEVTHRELQLAHTLL